MYLTSHNSKLVFRYNAINGEGMELPNSPYENSFAVAFDGRLVLVGGNCDSCVTNKLVTLHYNGQWVEDLPSMKCARSNCSAVCIRNTKFRNHLVVVGGKSQDGSPVSDVEFLNTLTKTWYTLTHLPQLLTAPSATLCDNRLHVISNEQVGFSCSVQSLISYDDGNYDDDSQPLPSNLDWLSLPRLPARDAALGTLRGQLVLLGGQIGDESMNSIHQLVGNEWVKIGSMLLSRRECLAVSASREKVIVLGGVGTWNNVELCNAD